MKKVIFTVASLLTIGYSLLTNSAMAQVVSTLAGSTTSGSADGTGAAASFYWPSGVATDASGNLYVADAGNNEIRQLVISTGVVTTLCGSTISGSADGTGTAAGFYGPTGICSDGSGNLYVADQNNNEIRKIVIATGVVSTLAGSTTPGSADGTGTAASFYWPSGVATDASGNLYVADYYNNEIRKIVISTGVVTTFAGNLTGGSADGTGAAASFNRPTGVCTDGSGNLYVADESNNEIRKIVIATGVVTTFAGTPTSGYADGTGAAATFNQPSGVCSDGSGNLYVADYANNEIRKIVIATGVVTTFAGSTTQGHADGTGTAAGFYYPIGVCSDASGNLYVADQGNHEIRKINLGGAGIQQYTSNNEQVSVYPNPANDVLNLTISQFDNLKMNSVEVYNMLGECVYRQIVTSNNCQIDISDLDAGVYQFIIHNSKFSINKRIVKQ